MHGSFCTFVGDTGLRPSEVVNLQENAILLDAKIPRDRSVTFVGGAISRMTDDQPIVEATPVAGGGMPEGAGRPQPERRLGRGLIAGGAR